MPSNAVRRPAIDPALIRFAPLNRLQHSAGTMDPTVRALFRPGKAAVVALIAVGCTALACALYIRYRLVEQAGVGLACQAGLESISCAVRKYATALFTHSAFGTGAAILATLNLIRPSLVLFIPALVLACFGIVLYNANLAALAIAWLVLSLARRVPEPE